MSTCILCSAGVGPGSSLVWRKDGHDVVRCPECGLLFRADPPDERELTAIYDEDYFRDRSDGTSRHGYADYLRDEPLHRANARRRVRLLGAPGRLVDVGCAGGFFVAEARRAGWDASGVDVSAAMTDFAREALGLPVVCSTWTDAPVPPELAAVTMWDYLEHSLDPRRDLELAHERLRAGGLLALSTGDAGSAVARLFGRRWHLLTPEHHNFFFSGATLRRLLAETGFEVVEARRRGALYSPAHVLYKLESVAPSPLVRTASRRIARSRLGPLAVPLNLYDIVTVVSRRR